MNTQTHTPGPWRTNSQGFGTIYIDARAVVDARLLQEICAVGPTESGREQQEANARLIAAAPELLAAARLGLDLALGLEGMSQNNALAIADEYARTIRAAIAKATGASHES